MEALAEMSKWIVGDEDINPALCDCLAFLGEPRALEQKDMTKGLLFTVRKTRGSSDNSYKGDVFRVDAVSWPFIACKRLNKSWIGTSREYEDTINADAYELLSITPDYAVAMCKK